MKCYVVTVAGLDHDVFNNPNVVQKSLAACRHSVDGTECIIKVTNDASVAQLSGYTSKTCDEMRTYVEDEANGFKHTECSYGP